MKKEVPAWVWGCGIGCGALVLLAVVGMVGLGVFVRNTSSGFSAATETRKTLEARFGKADEFAPWSDGSIPKERIEAFIAVRQATQDYRDGIARTFEALPTTREQARQLEQLSGWEKFTKSLSIARSAIGLGGGIGNFFKARNEALLEQEMGMGEYTYLYVIAYYSWLGKSPEDGLASRAGGVKIETRQFERRVRERMLKMMERQLESAAPGDWRDRLAAEVEAMRSDPGHIPWRDDLPPPLASSLQPYRAQLEESYNAITNEFELGLNRSRGWGSYTVD